MNPGVLLQENFCSKSLFDIPEQNSLFQEQSFENNLPHVKPFMNTENPQNIEDKNLYEIDANALSACMDLINNDKDLKRIVQGIDSLGQLDNNYLPFIPSDSSGNFLNANLCDEKEVCSEVLQKSIVSDKNNGFNNYALNQEQFQSQGNSLDEGKSYNSVFEFTEKKSKSVQKLIHSKPHASYTEKISINTSNISNELAYSSAAEMIKVTVTECGHNKLESLETCLKDNQKANSPTIVEPKKVRPKIYSCPYCSKKLCSAGSVKRHVVKIHPSVQASDSRHISERSTNLSSPADKANFSSQLENIGSGSGNSYDRNAINCPLLSDKQNPAISDSGEISDVLPKSRVKGLIKSPTSQCKFCGKTLTSMYMKKHILKLHQEFSKKTENSSSNLKLDVNPSSSSQTDLTNISTTSPLLEQDIDSSTCLSISDALKRSNSYMIAENSNLSESDKFVENTDVKFNFNVLEFSKDTKIDYKLPSSEENVPLKSVECTPENAKKVEENINNNVLIKQNRYVEQRHSCDLCTKSYAHLSVLNRHLKTVHKVTIIRTQKKSNVINHANKTSINIEGNDPLPSDPSSKPSDDEISNKKCTNLSNISHVGKSAHAAVQVQKIKEKYRKSSSKDHSHRQGNKSLLKAVLESNFQSKQLEIKDYNETKDITSSKVCNPIHDNELNFCDPTKTSESDQRLCEAQFPYASKDCENLERNMCSSESKSDKSVSVSVPFEKLSKTEISIRSVKCLIPGTSECNTSLPTDFEFSGIKNELHGPNENSQIGYSDLTNSQNLSIQSSEISPISEIISNVSKCQFGGTSNNDIKKEIFEDNSLKLPIPESQEKLKDNKTMHDSCDMKLDLKQNFLEIKDHINTSYELDISEKQDKLTGLCSDIKIENQDDESWEQANDSDKNCVRCRLCHQNLDSMEILSKHLKEIHDIPVLKKHTSHPVFTDEMASSEKPGKLSPPKLKLGTNESESESELDNPHSWPQPLITSQSELSQEALCDSSELETSKGALYDSSELESCKETPCDSLELDMGNEGPFNSSELDMSKKGLINSSDLCTAKGILCDTSELVLPKYVGDSSELELPKYDVGDSSELDASKYDTCDSSELVTYQNDTLSSDNLCTLSEQGEQNEETTMPSSPCKLEKSCLQLECEDVKDQINSITVQSLNLFVPNSKQAKTGAFSVCQNKFRWHSLLNRNIDPLIENCEKIPFDMKNNSHKELKKSASLPNLKVALQHITDQTKYKVNSPKSPFEKHSTPYSENNTSLSCVTDNTEICKTSFGSSSNSPPVHWNKITINSGLILPNTSLNPSVSKVKRRKTILRSKFAGKKLIIQRLKTYEKQKKNKKIKTNYFTEQKKLKAKKTFNPIILTLKETTEISDFLKTHKQPFVKLIRLKENDFDYWLNKKNDPAPEIVCNKYDMKEAVVKLERMDIPCDKVVLINQELLVPHVLSQNAHHSIITQSHRDESINCPNSFYLASDNADVLPEVSLIQSLPKEDIELCDMNNSNSSSDSVQFLGAITRQEMCQIKTEDFCSIPSTKKCFVVLNRVSV